jgi:release factor glutamine methyltransferase
MSRSGLVREFDTVGALVLELTKVFETQVGASSARADAVTLVADVLDRPVSWVRRNSEEAIDSATYATCVRAGVDQASGMPHAYAVGKAAFRHLVLDVDPRVLIPRPETEVLVEEVLNLPIPAGGVAVDVGTGSGAIVLSLAHEGRFDRVIGVDISSDALSVARANLRHVDTRARAHVEFLQGSLLAPLGATKVDVIVSNPPYIAYGEAEDLPPSVRDYEPAVALFSGHDGMGITKALVCTSPDHLLSGGWLALEVDARRAGLVAQLLAFDGRYTDIQVRLDLAGRERVVLARLAE